MIIKGTTVSTKFCGDYVMRSFKKMIFTAAAFVASSFTFASAAEVTTFEFSGTANAGVNSLTVGPGFPTGGVQQIDDGNSSPTSFASLVGEGDDNPLTFASGAAAAGEADATMTTSVKVEITNDTGVVSEALLNSLIFAGGVGIANPDFSAADCDQSNIAQCGSYLSGDLAVILDQSASLDFAVLSNGATVLDGDIAVDSSGVSSNFNGIALENFGPSSGNPDFVTWDDTAVNVSLGMLNPGETLTLEFLVQVRVVSTGQSGCTPVGFECRISMAGFGDPKEMGGVIMFALQGMFPIGVDLEPMSEIPLPPAAFLFLFGAAGLARQGMKRKA